MAFENKDLTGALFKNEYKQKNSQPDHTGTCRINGVNYKIAAWNRTTRRGSHMLSLAFTEVDESFDIKNDKIDVKDGKIDINDEIIY